VNERKLKRNFRNEVNPSSMADIAFLLLIFFLVSTTINIEEGILIKLPPYSDIGKTAKVADRNLCVILVNHQNKILVRGQEMEVELITDFVKEFISNPYSKSNLAENPTKAVISLQNDRSTSYTKYIQVFNELKKAYNQLRDEQAQISFGLPFDACNSIQQKQLISQIPIIISESEPADYTVE